jgi:hypothetical protein
MAETYKHILESHLQEERDKRSHELRMAVLQRDAEEHKASLQRQAEEHKALLQRQAEEHKASLLRQAEEHKASLHRQPAEPRDASSKKRPHRSSEENPEAVRIKEEISDFIVKETKVAPMESSMTGKEFSNKFKASFERHRNKQLTEQEYPLFKRHWLSCLEKAYKSIHGGKHSTHISGVSLKTP